MYGENESSNLKFSDTNCPLVINYFILGRECFVDSFLDVIPNPRRVSTQFSRQEAQRKSRTKGNICYQVYRPDI